MARKPVPYFKRQISQDGDAAPLVVEAPGVRFPHAHVVSDPLNFAHAHAPRGHVVPRCILRPRVHAQQKVRVVVRVPGRKLDTRDKHVNAVHANSL